MHSNWLKALLSSHLPVYSQVVSLVASSRSEQLNIEDKPLRNVSLVQ
jgi:hypothetical protein